MTEIDRLDAIFKAICKLEIKGAENVQILYNVLGFIQSEILKIKQQEENPLPKE